MRGQPDTAVIIHPGAPHTSTLVLPLLTVIAAEWVQNVFVCAVLNAGEKLQHLPEPHQPAEGHPAPQWGPRGQTEPGLQHTV